MQLRSKFHRGRTSDCSCRYTAVQVVSQACPDLRQGAGAYTLSHQSLVKGRPRGHKFPAACEQNWLQKLKGKLL